MTPDPKPLSTILARKAGRSGCSRSIANFRDVIHGSKRHIERPPSCSARSIGSSEFLNPITHEVIVSNSRCELKITGFGGGGGSSNGNASGGSSTFVGTLRPGTPGPGGHTTMHYFNSSHGSSSTPSRKSPFLLSGREGSGLGQSSNRVSVDADSYSGSTVTCHHKCGEQFTKWEASEAHHLSKHAALRQHNSSFNNFMVFELYSVSSFNFIGVMKNVTELVEGDSSRKIVEIICRASWLKSVNHYGRIEKVLKVHNMGRTLARFEEYREMVKIKASKLGKKHPRCLADGNELLRFYGTTVACSLGLSGSSSLCLYEKCCVCRIIRNGFSTKKELKSGIGVFSTSTSERAFECIGVGDDNPSVRKALIVCRVIAGRVHKPLENIQEIAGQAGFDSLAGKVGLYSNTEELYLLNPRALLPCFVVICKHEENSFYVSHHLLIYETNAGFRLT